MTENYERFIGKEVVDFSETDRNGEHPVYVVAGIDPECGITMVCKEDPTERTYCLVHPDIFKTKHGFEANNGVCFDKAFRFMVECIESGAIPENYWAIEKGAQAAPFGVSSTACAFS